MAPIRIVAVDDEVLNNELLLRTFRGQTSYSLQVFVDIPKALLHITQGEGAQILLLDQSMPEMSGTELAQEVVRRGFRPRILLITAFPELKEVVSAWESGTIDGIVPKPWRAVDVLRAVERVAGRL